MNSTSIPIIDLEGFYGSDSSEHLRIAMQIDDACRNIGFFSVIGHQVPAELIAQVDSSSREFFALPLEHKLALKRPKDDQVRGYSAIGNEGLSYSLGKKAPGDLKESLSIGPIAPPDEPYYSEAMAGPHFAPNLFPPEVPLLKQSWEEYFEAMASLAADLMRLFAIGLALPNDYFDSKIDKHISMFRVLHYPNQADEPEAGQLRAGAHSDYGSLTILKVEDRPGGLQVFSKDKEWVNVPVVPNAFLVNIGDLMMQWTNDQWVSTLHRVVNPPRDLSMASARQSLVFFHQPNYNAVVECLPSCLAKGEAPKYAPISSGDHLRNKFLAQTTFGQSNTVGSKEAI